MDMRMSICLYYIHIIHLLHENIQYFSNKVKSETVFALL